MIIASPVQRQLAHLLFGGKSGQTGVRGIHLRGLPFHSHRLLLLADGQGEVHEVLASHGQSDSGVNDGRESRLRRSDLILTDRKIRKPEAALRGLCRCEGLPGA